MSSTESFGSDNAGTSTSRVLLSSSAATIFTKSLLHPIDTIKCRIQLLHYQPSRKPLSIVDQLSLTASQERCRGLREAYRGKWGLRYLYSGLPIKLLLYIPYQSTYMSTYHLGRQWWEVDRYRQQQDEGGRSSYLWRTAAAAVTAEVGSCVVRVPMETIKLRVQSTAQRNTGEAVKGMLRQGWRANLALLVPQTLLHDIPYSVVQWILYETLRPYTTRFTLGGEKEREREVAALSGEGRGWRAALSKYRSELFFTFCSGGMSGMLASALTVPLDNIRTHYTVRSAVAATTAQGTASVLSVRSTIAALYQRKGWRGFYAGGGTRVLWVSLNMAVYFPLFELFKKMTASPAVAAVLPTELEGKEKTEKAAATGERQWPVAPLSPVEEVL